MKLEYNIKNILIIGLPILTVVIIIIFLIFYFKNKFEKFSINNSNYMKELKNEGCAPNYRGANDTKNDNYNDTPNNIPNPSCNNKIDYGRVHQDIKELQKPNVVHKQVHNHNKEPSIEVILVHADWCGYSKKAEPEFDKLLNEMNNTKAGEHILKIKKYEEKKNAPEFKKIVSDLGINGFPTIVVRDNNGKNKTFNSIEYNDMKSKLFKEINDNWGNNIESVPKNLNEYTEPTIEVILVYADWCGYSRKAEPHFDKLLEEINDTEIKEHILEIKKYEEKKNTPEFKEIVSDAEIKGFPTIVVRTKGTTFKDNKTYTFNSIEYNDMKSKLIKVINNNY